MLYAPMPRAAPAVEGYDGREKSNSNFKIAVEAWKSLSDEQRKAYTSHFKNAQAGAEPGVNGGQAAAAPPVAAEATGATEPAEEFIADNEEEDDEEEEEEEEVRACHVANNLDLEVQGRRHPLAQASQFEEAVGMERKQSRGLKYLV